MADHPQNKEIKCEYVYDQKTDAPPQDTIVFSDPYSEESSSNNEEAPQSQLKSHDNKSSKKF